MIFRTFRFKSCLFIPLFVLSVLYSCTPLKKQIYLSKGNFNEEVNNNNITNTYKLQKGDMLYVKVQTMDEKTYKLFNSEWINSSARNELSTYLESYTISDSGNIDLPIIGKINVSGLTIVGAQEKIQKNLSTYLLDAKVVLKLVNFKITVLGEVIRPGTYKVYDNNINVLEAISMAGDMTVFGNRENILVLRKGLGNKHEYLDITDVNIVNSEYFQLIPNDVVYVQPTVAKTLGFKEFPFSILFSSITTLIVLINFLSK